MKKIILAIDKHSDSLTKKLDPRSATTIKGWLLKILIAVVVLFLFLNTLCTICGLFMIYLTRLCGYLIFTCIITSFCIVVLGLLCKKVIKELWIIAVICSWILMIAGVGLFGFGGVVSMEFVPIRTYLFPKKIQFPLGEVQGIAVDSTGRIYLAIHGYSRIQVYDRYGYFLKGWFVKTGGGHFDIWTDGNDHVHAVISRPDTHDIFDSNGQLLERKKIKSFEEYSLLDERAGGLNDQDNFYNTYFIKSPTLFPRIIKRTANGEEFILIKDPIYYWIVESPLPAWFVGALGLFMLFILKTLIEKKVEVSVTNTNQHR